MEALILEYGFKILYALTVFLAGYGVSAIKGEYHDRRAMKDGIQALLRTEILRIHSTAMEYQCISFTQKENITHMYKAYKDLGGNGVVERMMPSLDALKVVSDIDAMIKYKNNHS
mgnify:FL=1